VKTKTTVVASGRREKLCITRLTRCSYPTFLQFKQKYPSVDKKNVTFFPFVFTTLLIGGKKFSLLNSLPLHPQTVSLGMGGHPVD
jgi:hypothetical protein